MKIYNLHALQGSTDTQILSQVLPGSFIYTGGLAFCKPGERSHNKNGPEGIGRHTHTDCEAFLILQGIGTMEVEGIFHPIKAGDLLVIEPGEDHHLISSLEDPIVTLWCHAGPNRHGDQTTLS